MMDCSKTEVFFNEFKRMCKSYHTDKQAKEECKIHHIVENCGECMGFVKSDTSLAIKFVQEWSDSHPQKTRLSVFLEQYPNCRKGDVGEPRICAGSIYNFNECVYDTDGNRDCVSCWNTRIEEM